MPAVSSGGCGCIGLGAPCGAPESQGFVCVVCIVVRVKRVLLWLSKPKLEALGGLRSMEKALVTHRLGRVSLRSILVPFESINVSFSPSCSLVDGPRALLYLLWSPDWLLVW